MKFRTLLFIQLLIALSGSALLVTVAGKFLARDNSPEWMRPLVEFLYEHPWQVVLSAAIVGAVLTVIKETWGKGVKDKGEAKGAGGRDRSTGPKQPSFVHRHPLAPSFAGRVAEKAELTTWFLGGAERLLVVWDTGIGGMGKTELSYAWLWQTVLGNELPAALQTGGSGEEAVVAEGARPVAVLWYSFEEPQTSFEDFIDTTLVYLEGITRQEVSAAPMTEKIGRLTSVLSLSCVLLVLDAFEHQLRAYTTSPEGEGEAVPLRSCVDSHAEQFLRQAAALNGSGRVLITTRMIPATLETADRRMIAGCRLMRLGGLMPSDAVALFRNAGVVGTDAEIQRACGEYDYHPLAIRLLLGLILHDPNNRGDIRAADSYSVPAEMRGRNRQHILDASYRALATNNRRLLSQIAAFREPIPYAAALRFNPYPSEGPFRTALSELENRHLIRLNRDEARYDLHPVVRRFAYERLVGKEDTHRTARDYYASFPIPEQDDLRSIRDLLPVIERSYHAAKAGLFDEACSVLEDDGRAEVLLHAFAGHEVLHSLLRQVFPDGLDSEPRLTDWQAQCWAINLLAICCSRLGDEGTATQLHQMTAGIVSGRGDRRSTAIVLTNLSIGHIRLGLLAQARVRLEYALRVAADQEPFVQAGVRTELGKFYWLVGELTKSAEQTQAVHALTRQFNDRNMEAVCLGDEAEREAAYGRFDQVEELVNRSKSAAVLASEVESLRHDWLLGSVSLHHAMHKWIGKSKLLARAEAHFSTAMNRATQSRLAEWEARVRVSVARVRAEQRRWGESRAQIAEAMRIADRHALRLLQADVSNAAAAIELAAGDWRRARGLAEAALERAACDGPPNAYKPATVFAEELLLTIGRSARRAEFWSRWRRRLGISWLTGLFRRRR